MDQEKSMQQNTTTVFAQPMNRLAKSATHILASEIGGVPVAIVACAVAAAIVGGLVAVTTGS
jgi:hypothetical protein